MPYLKLSTNQTLSHDERNALLARASKLAAQQLGKPERYVMVEIHSGAALLFGGSDAPAAYLELKSIGLSAAQTRPLSQALSALLQEALGIPPDRVYIEFGNIDGSWWGWNGGTF
jgi:phenylpyruvate tautomerase PptA (4-oxalocrotonate tautomerase family)